jgi:hypothetical protein
MNEQELLKRLGALPGEISPRNDPWPEIHARISGEHAAGLSGGDAARPHRRGWLPMAAAAVLIAITAGLIFRPLQVGGPESAVDSAAMERAPRSHEALRLQGALAASEVEYQAAFREFIPVGDSRNNLPMQTIESIESGWAELVSTESVLAAALEENPENSFLNDRMFELRARQLGFLKQLAKLDRNNRRMTI